MNKFITSYVSELYVVLIGIGLANVLFNIEFSYTNIIPLLTACLVTLYISFYWWDWVNHIESNFIETMSEFIIDFLILISLFFLFINYNSPILLATNLLLISLLDLLWVFHFQIHKKKLDLKWISRKIIVTSIFSLLVTTIFYSQNQFDEKLLSFIVMGVSIIVKKTFFKDIATNIDTITFRKARKSDTRELQFIAAESKLSNNNSDSFIINNPDFSILNDNQSRIIVAVKDRKICGYLIMDDFKDMEYGEDLNYLIEDEMASIKSQSTMIIEQIAVKKSHRGQGIAKHLINHAIHHCSSINLVSFVAIAPHKNSPSINLHEKLGFVRIGKFSSDNFKSIENYQSILYSYKRC
ncbi:GNAT family N-acetyltransferase [Shewanella corallii]|uniref:GNAT family N-acetyltransferase n=1 Tax=Shewanella corallii TaxID=560080 RepID=A0ABT0N5A7_9GAMM|nr:GNAT family N-acetyltransferase [Shewanella corallii]MCL2913626.1 GNAT family N-acetyltransferase [Shewanella corallii]